MEKEQQNAAEDTALSAENIAGQITEELQKVVGIDQDTLRTYVRFLAGLPTKSVEKMLKALKKDLDEKMLPLLELITQEPDATFAELGVSALGTVQSFKAAQLLSEINDEHPDKKLRKAARKSLYKLKSAGIDVETTHKALLGESKHERYKCLISAVDGTGTQLFMLTQEMLAGDLHLLQIVASDEEGIVECSAKRGMSKKMFDRLPETFAAQMGGQGPMLVEADYDYAMSLILHTEQAGDYLPDDYRSNKEFFGFGEAASLENPVYQEFDVEVLKNQPEIRETCQELFLQDTFLGWHIPVPEMGEYAQELIDQEDTALELSPQLGQERRSDVYQKVIEAKLNDETLTRLQRRLEIMAYVFLLHENREDAQKALFAAVTLPETEQNALKDHPFIKELVRISLEAARCVLEDGYDPEAIEKTEYVLAWDDEGEIVVEFVEPSE